MLLHSPSQRSDGRAIGSRKMAMPLSELLASVRGGSAHERNGHETDWTHRPLRSHDTQLGRTPAAEIELGWDVQWAFFPGDGVENGMDGWKMR